MLKKRQGGQRPGSGRPKGSGRFKEPTSPIRVPNGLLITIQNLLLQYKDNLQTQIEAPATYCDTMTNVIPFESSFKSSPLIKKEHIKESIAIYELDPYAKQQAYPLYASKVAAGFPSPADDYIEAKLDLNQYLVKHPAATFFVRVEGESMIGAGIHPNDILVVDRSLKPVDGKIVIAVVNGELTVKRLKIANNGIILWPENDKFPPIRITEEMNFSIWGVVTSVIHSL